MNPSPSGPGAGRPRAPRARPCGGFALLATVLVLALMSLLAAWGQAALPLAWLRDGTRELMALQARAAADSGLAMALAMMNEPHGTGASCESLDDAPSGGWLDALVDPSADGGSLSLRAGAAGVAAPPGAPTTPGRGVPSTPSAPTVPVTAAAEIHCRAQPATAGSPPTWACRCRAPGDSGGAAAGAGAAHGPPSAAFSVRWWTRQQGGRTSTGAEAAGCVRADGDCRRPPQGLEAASTLRRVGLTAWPALVRIPAATATAGGSIRLGPAVRLRNHEPASGGRVLHAGRDIDLAGAEVEGLPGAPLSDRIRRLDAALARISGEAFAEGLLGVTGPQWRQAPRVRHLPCAAPGTACAERVQAEVRRGVQALAVSGRLELTPGFRLGSAQRPVLLVVEGAVQLNGPGELHGLVVADAIEADGRFGDIDWRGAAVARGDLVLTGRVQLLRDPAALSPLARLRVGVMPTPGSWREPLEGETTP